MLRYLSHHQINRLVWDNCVAASGQRIVYAFSWYLDTVCKQWDAVVEEQDGNYVSVFPLPLGRWFGQLGVLQPYFTQQLGLFTTAESQEREVKDYLAYIPEKYKGIYLQLNTANTLVAASLPAYAVQERVTYLVSLEAGYSALRQRYSTNQKRNLKKAVAAGVQLSSGEDVRALIQLFKETKGRELREVKEKHYIILAKLYRALQEHEAAAIVQVTDASGNLLAAALLVLQPDKIIFLFGASSEAGKGCGAMAFLLDNIIQQHAGSKRVLDFEGSMVPSVAKFYANFGATPVPYVSITRQHTPWYLSWKKETSTY